MREPLLITLGEAISNAERLDREAYIYLPKKVDRWAWDTGVMVLNNDEGDWEEDEAGIPLPARENGLEADLGVDDLRGVRDNLLQQGALLDPELLLRAVRFYYERDAYLEEG